MLAASSTAGIVLLALGALFVDRRRRSRCTSEAAPRSSRPTSRAACAPGPSDAALETPLLQKLQGWGVVLVAFFVIWIPYTWLREPSENLGRKRSCRTLALDRGELAVQPFSEENQLGVGCVRCHGPELRGGVDPGGRPPTRTRPTSPTSARARSATRRTARSSPPDDIYQVIEEGRGAMPSWSIRYQGALERPADQRPRRLPGGDELGERAVRGQRLPEPRGLGAGARGEPPENGGAGLNPRDP